MPATLLLASPYFQTFLQPCKCLRPFLQSQGPQRKSLAVKNAPTTVHAETHNFQICIPDCIFFLKISL